MVHFRTRVNIRNTNRKAKVVVRPITEWKTNAETTGQRRRAVAKSAQNRRAYRFAATGVIPCFGLYSLDKIVLHFAEVEKKRD